MSNSKTPELRTLDDEDLMGVVGGGGSGCAPQPPCHPQPRCHPSPPPCGGIEVVIFVPLCL